MTTIRIVIVFIIGILLVVLAIQNAKTTSDLTVFYRTYYGLSLALIMLYAFIFGLIIAGIFWVVSEIKVRHQLRHQKKENEALLAELTALRNLPLDMDTEGSMSESATECRKETK